MTFCGTRHSRHAARRAHQGQRIAVNTEYGGGEYAPELCVKLATNFKRRLRHAVKHDFTKWGLSILDLHAPSARSDQL